VAAGLITPPALIDGGRRQITVDKNVALSILYPS